MDHGRHSTIFLTIAAMLAACFPPSVALGKKRAANATSGMDERRRIVYALDRLTFGPRPSDLDRVQAEGLDKWIDQQLHPERINDSALQARLSSFRTLAMDRQQLVENYPTPQLLKAAAAGKASQPSDAAQRNLRQIQLAGYEARQAAKSNPVEAEEGLGDKGLEQLASLPTDQRVAELTHMSPGEIRSLVESTQGEDRGPLMRGLTPEQRTQVQGILNPAAVPANELVQAKLLRATYSERQLQEVMTDFWFNHFNVFSGKGADRFLLTEYERDVIRPRVFGKFEDLLVATAQSPAMLFYLDNWLSEGPNSDAAKGVPRNNGGKKRQQQGRQQKDKSGKGQRNGLNENYGRELMELHTLGVDGGYTQKDVTEVARVFTGWTLERPNQGGGYRFDARLHDPGDKRVLGHTIKEKGEKEGREVLHLLAHQPATARFISRKLATRFVSDDPPASLVDRMTKTYLKKDGEIREVLKTMLESPEFWAANNYRSKVKTPLEFVVSALRASDAQVSDAMPIARALQNLGMPMYGMQAPTGYPLRSDAWVNSAALLGRMNFALALASGKLYGTQMDMASLLPGGGNDPSSSLTLLENALLEGDASQQTRAAILAQAQDPALGRSKLARTPPQNVVAGLLIGSPEFQRR